MGFADVLSRCLQRCISWNTGGTHHPIRLFLRILCFEYWSNNHWLVSHDVLKYNQLRTEVYNYQTNLFLNWFQDPLAISFLSRKIVSKAFPGERNTAYAGLMRTEIESIQNINFFTLQYRKDMFFSSQIFFEISQPLMLFICHKADHTSAFFTRE